MKEQDSPPLGDLFQRAFALAQEAHAGQVRKGSRIPYLSHPMQVAGIALEYGADEEQAAAALLHDVLEDSATTYEDLQGAFGTRVADIVRHCSDTEDHKEKGAWCERKKAYLRHLATADQDTLLVSCADKVHNARSLAADVRQHRPPYLQKFNGKHAGTLWYYAALVDAFQGRDVPAGLLAELTVAVEALTQLAGPAPASEAGCA